MVTVTDDLDVAIVKYSPFISELRKRLLFTVAIFLIFSIVGFFYYENVVRLILSIFGLEGVNVVFTSPFQFFSLSLNIALLLGVIGILPMAIFQFLSFIKPALKRSEYKKVLFLLPISLLLFAIGFIFGALIMKYVVIIFYQKSVELSIGNLLDISKLLSQIVLTATLMGSAFEFPIVFTILMKLNIVNYKYFVKRRLWIYAFSLLFTIMLPPTDILSLILLFLPLVLLFELTLLLNKYILKSHLL